jgi:nucleoside-diphosphate-sugar epimerase
MDIEDRLNPELRTQAKSSRIFVAGHNGLVGSAILDTLRANGYTNIITVEKSQLNLLNQSAVLDFLKTKTLIKFILQLQKLGVFLRITHIQLILYIKI